VCVVYVRASCALLRTGRTSLFTLRVCCVCVCVCVCARARSVRGCVCVALFFFFSNYSLYYLLYYLLYYSLYYSLYFGGAGAKSADWSRLRSSVGAYCYLLLALPLFFFLLIAVPLLAEAKSLLEQTALICQGRPFYPAVLKQIKLYIRNDLRRLDIPPVELIAQSPRNDPLEKIMFMTSVGVPSVIYETVKNLRQARGHRLGACQRKFPRLGIWLLYILATLELAAFPLLGAGTMAGLSVKMDPSRVFGLQSLLFSGLTGATVLVLRIIEELWQSSGGTFNVDETLSKMVVGLEAELDERAKAGGNVDNGVSKLYGADDDIPRG
jgi:hypothetical protein